MGEFSKIPNFAKYCEFSKCPIMTQILQIIFEKYEILGDFSKIPNFAKYCDFP